MKQLDPTFERVARRAYEGARVRRALLGVLPVVALAALASLFTTELATTAAAGAALIAAGVICLWWGHDFQRALVPGLMAGAFPLMAVICTARYGHLCFGDWCMTACFVSSGLGGIGSGLIVGGWWRKKHARLAIVATAAGVGLVTGAMGTTCIGSKGHALMAAGFVAAFAVQWLRGKAPVEAKVTP